MYRTVRGKRSKGSTKQLVNKISSYGIMAGLIPKRGLPNISRYINRHSTGKIVIPSAPDAGILYMQGANPMNKYMLSRNPVGSGGVGKMIPNIPCCSAKTLTILRPVMVNQTNVDNSDTGITTITEDKQQDDDYNDNYNDNYDDNYYV